MQCNSDLGGFGGNIRRAVLIAATVMLLPSCAIFGLEKNSKNPQTASKTVKQITAADNVAKFLMTANVGEQRKITLKDGRRITVIAGGRYISALGLSCRRGNIHNDRGEAMVNAACLENSVWKTVIRP